jgi:hypothetical protein
MNKHFLSAVAVAASLAVVGSTGAVTGALASPTSRSNTHATKKNKHHNKRHASKASVPRAVAVSADLAASFAALRRPAALTVPGALRKLIDGGDAYDRYGVNPTLTRQIPAPDGDTGHPWYIVPGNQSLCLFDGSFMACQTLTDAIAGRLMVRMYKPSGMSPFPAPGSTVHMTAVGLVPDGYTGVHARTKSGEIVAGALSNNAYQITVDDPSSLSFDGPAANASPIGIEFL